jgi:hypothetical protein
LIDILSGAVGGVIVFVLTVLWAAIRDGRQQVRACIGYTRLLEAEVESNYLVVNRLEFPSSLEELAKGESFSGESLRTPRFPSVSDISRVLIFPWPTPKPPNIRCMGGGPRTFGSADKRRRL